MIWFVQCMRWFTNWARNFKVQVHDDVVKGEVKFDQRSFFLLCYSESASMLAAAVMRPIERGRIQLRAHSNYFALC